MKADAMECVVDVFDASGAQVGAYVVNLAGAVDKRDFEQEAIRCAIEDGDAEEMDREGLRACIRTPRTMNSV